MSEIEVLRQRKELVLLSCDLQRATIARRAQRIRASSAGRALGSVAHAVGRPAVWKYGPAVLAIVSRVWKRRKQRKQLSNASHI